MLELLKVVLVTIWEVWTAALLETAYIFDF